MAGLLPIGSIVKLSNHSEVCYMISGYYPQYQQEIREYTAVLYPGGLSGFGQLEMFNQEQIREILFEGFQHEDTRKLLERIPEFMECTSALMQESNVIMEQALHEIGDRTDELEETADINIEME